MSRNKVSEKIEMCLNTLPEGYIFTARDFGCYDSQDAVNRSLSRLNSQGSITRIMQGVYKKNSSGSSEASDSSADAYGTAKALARRYGWSITPTGETVLRCIGLSDNKSDTWFFISTGPYREFEFNGCKLSFKHSSSRYFIGFSEKTRLAIQAIKSMGRNSARENIKAIASYFTKKEREVLLKEGILATAWIYEIIKIMCSDLML